MPNFSPLVSLIMPSYNAEEYIEEMIASVKNQTYQSWECIIVDDHSTDNTFAIAERVVKGDTRFILVKRPEHKPKGGNSCRNYGFELSNGKYINWIDADDVLHPEMVGLKVDILELNKSLDFVVAQTGKFTERFDYDNLNNHKGYHTTLMSNNVIEDYIIGRITFYTVGPMWRKLFLSHKPLFDESLFVLQEWDFYTRLLLKSPKYNVIEKPLYFHRRHNASISGYSRVKNKSKLKSYLVSREKVFSHLNESNLLSEKILRFYLNDYINLLTAQIQISKFYYTSLIISKIIGLSKILHLNNLALLKLTAGLTYFLFTKRRSRLLELKP